MKRCGDVVLTYIEKEQRATNERNMSYTQRHAVIILRVSSYVLYNHSAGDMLKWELTDSTLARAMFSSGCWSCGGTFLRTGIPNTLDRIQCSLGYTTDNILPCCHRCNMTRNVMSLHECVTLYVCIGLTTL